MMGKKDRQMQMLFIDINTMIPENHLLKQIDKKINFGFIYELAAPYYSTTGRKSVDPVMMIKMLLIGYLYGIKSERRLVEEVNLNIAYRWFCGLELSDKVPEHSLFSQNRRRRFCDSILFRDIFNRIIIECIEQGIVTGENIVSDGSFIPANVSSGSKIEVKQTVLKSTVHYMDELDEEMSQQKGYRKAEPTEKEVTVLKSRTDPECGYIHQERKKGLGYLAQMTVDTENGIIIGVDCYPANRRESDIVLEHLKRIKQDTGLRIKNLALDAGYDVGAVHRGLELLGITGYVSRREFHNAAMRKGFIYLPEQDCFKCMKNQRLEYESFVYKKTSQGYYRVYSRLRSKCKGCEYLTHCAMDRGRIRINASPFYPAFYANMQRCETAFYKAMKRLRAIWSEGTFAVLKREHNLKRTRKRGLERASEECLLSALALNLKRMVKTTGDSLFTTSVTIISCFFIFQQVARFYKNMTLSTGP